MRKYFIICCIAFIYCFTSCNSEERIIKKALKNTIETTDQNNYKYIDHKIIEIVHDFNLKDSITTIANNITLNEKLIQEYKSYLSELERNKEECQIERSSTLYFLRRDFDNLIEDYQDMIEDNLRKISQVENRIESDRTKLSIYQTAIQQCNSPYIFFKIKHEYLLNKSYKKDLITLDWNYKPIKF